MTSAPTAGTPTRLGPPAGARLVVTGGCGGIGRALVAAALADGLEVAVLDLPASIERHPPPRGALAIPLDATDEPAVAAAFAEVGRRWPALDGLVNLAGFARPGSWLADTREDWEEVTPATCARPGRVPGRAAAAREGRRPRS
jgi:3-oxoacyl-[acyl-carrier protein] reductase